MSSPYVLPNGSTILVTGANGFIGSHIVEQLLSIKNADYKVRGTARSVDKLAGLQKKWDEQFGAGRFESVAVSDFLKEDALDECLKDVSAVAHVVSVVSFSPVYEDVVPQTVAFTLGALKSASKFPNIKRFVLTSSVLAAANLPGSAGDHTTEKDWNEEAKIKAQELPADDPSRAMWVYVASKTVGEQAAWNFVKEQKPSFEFNTVLPTLVIGRILDEATQSGSTGGYARDVFNGSTDFAKMMPAPYFVSVEDTALAHVGALLLPQVSGQRVIATTTPHSWDEFLAIYRELYPSRKFEDFSSAKGAMTFDTRRGTEILKEFGRDGWQSLESALEGLVGRE